VLLFVGRLAPEKGLEYLIQATERIVTSGIKDVALLIVGPNEYGQNTETQYMRKLRELVEQLKLNGHIYFIGGVPLQVLKELYFICDIFVLPSTTEAFGLVVSEAMFYGKPVVGTKVSGIMMQIQDGLNGLLVEPRNSDQLADKIMLLLRDPQLARALGERGKETVRKFDITKIASIYLKRFILLSELYNDVDDLVRK
jgi:glycosyltransferase involved in cell wall biosynthesis